MLIEVLTLGLEGVKWFFVQVWGSTGRREVVNSGCSCPALMTVQVDAF